VASLRLEVRRLQQRDVALDVAGHEVGEGGGSVERRHGADIGELATDFLGSGDALLDRWFTSERLKAALAWFGAQSGPPMSEPGTRATNLSRLGLTLQYSWHQLLYARHMAAPS